MVPVAWVCAQAVRARAGLPLVTEMGVGCLSQRVPAGSCVDRRAVAAPGRVVVETYVQATRVLRQNLRLVSKPSRNHGTVTPHLYSKSVFLSGLVGLVQRKET
jgi:hypothetical protein